MKFPRLKKSGRLGHYGVITTLFAALSLGVAKAGELKIVHINDHHSHLKSDGRMSLNLGGKSTRVVSGGMPSVVAKIKDLQNKNHDLLKLHAGDAVSGSLFFTLFKGEADAALMNEVCFDAFALGNHEFNEGDAGLAKFLDFLKSEKCNTPVLAANIKPEVGVSALTPNSETDYFQPYTVMQIDGMKIGIVGIDIVRKTKLSSSPDETTIFLDEAETAQRMVDELKQSVQRAVHEQKDPLLIYKFESFELFKEMIDQVNKDVISFLFKGEIPKETANTIQEAKVRRKEK